MALSSIGTYQKRALSEEGLLYHLWERGLRIDDRPAAIQALRTIGYYRLLIYLRTFQGSGKRYCGGAKFSDGLKLYEFDRSLRLHIMSGLERVEVALRVSLSDHMSMLYGPHWYMDASHFSSFVQFIAITSKINAECGLQKKSQSIALNHYYTNYSSPDLPPSWLVFDRLSFGQMSRAFEAMNMPERKVVSRKFNLDEKVLVSWLHSLTHVRNICAHHGRLWGISYSKFKPIQAKAFKSELADNLSLYSRCVILWALLRNCVDEADAFAWRDGLVTLLGKVQLPSSGANGFHVMWEKRAVWL